MEVYEGLYRLKSRLLLLCVLSNNVIMTILATNWSRWEIKRQTYKMDPKSLP